MKIPEFWFSSLAVEVRALCEQWFAAQPLAAEYERQLWKRLRLEWDYNSNHLEGNTLTYSETLLLLVHGQTRGEHLIREYEEMQGHDVAIEHIRTLAGEENPLTEGDLRDLNKLLLKEGYWRLAETPAGEQTRRWIAPGCYKKTPNHVLTRDGELFAFATPEETPAQMAAFVFWLREELSAPRERGLLEFLARLHHRFILIHPFDDGNGRLVRLLVNYVLLKFALPPLVIKTKERARYLAALRMADGGELEPLTTFLAEALSWSLRLGLQAATSLISLANDEDDRNPGGENPISMVRLGPSESHSR